MYREWFRLDTAALIFPAIAKSDWCNVFRLSATLNEDIDRDVLQQAVNDLKERFPSFYVTLHRGLFWYYLEQSKEPVTVGEEYVYPLSFMGRAELRKNCMRVLYYKNRIAVEFFHAITDGRGGSIYLKNLVARYITLKYNITVPLTDKILNLDDKPSAEELEDSFFKNSAIASASRSEATAYRLKGTKEPKGYKHLITGILSSDILLSKAHEYGASVTVFLAAVMARCIIDMQSERVSPKRQKPVKITLPVDLRRLYNSNTIRNFTLVLNIGVDPRFGEYTLQELCNSINHQLHTYATPQYMAGMIASNVFPQKNIAVRLAPLFIKNFVMNTVYKLCGERKGCINISNLGVTPMPEELSRYVSRMEFIIGNQRSYPNNCSVISCNGKTYINMIRNIKQSELERRFFSKLVELGIAVDIESNRGE